jgi:hydroxyacylglutathione hydrolase
MIVETFTAGPAQTNCYIVGCDQTRQAILIDPGWDGDKLLVRVDDLRLSVKLVLLTHAHFDHIGAVADVIEATGARLALHPNDLEWLKVDGGAAAFGFKIRPVPQPDILLQPGQPIELGSLSFETRFAPGHTLGHVIFVSSDQLTVFAGDVLFAGSIGRTDLPGGHYETLIESIRTQLLTLPDGATVYPGHGPPTTIGIERRNNPFLV